jgi:hypothetical protein
MEKPTYSFADLQEYLPGCSKEEYMRLFHLAVEEKKLYAVLEYTKVLLLFSKSLFKNNSSTAGQV